MRFDEVGQVLVRMVEVMRGYMDMDTFINVSGRFTEYIFITRNI